MKTIVSKNESDDNKIRLKHDIAEALFPKIRGKLLALFMLNPEKRYYFRETARIIGDAPASIQRELKALTAAGILTMEPIGIQKFYGANKESPIFEELKSIVRKTYGVTGVLKEALGPHMDKIKIAWINGSANSGRHREIDVTIIGSLWMGDLASILEPAEANLGRPINPILYTAEDYRRQSDKDNDLSRAEGAADTIFIIGDQSDLEKVISG